MKKYYSVSVGRKPGIYLTWDECREQTDHFPGAVFKKFKDRGQAEHFLEQKCYKKRRGRGRKRYRKPTQNTLPLPNSGGPKSLYSGARPPWEYPTFIECLDLPASANQ